MADLGFDRYGVQGGDAGAFVAQNLADLDRTHVCGLHLNTVPISRPKGDDAPLLTAAEEDALRDVRRWRTTGTGYSAIQSTKPQTLGCALEDSPAGLCAWIVEKFHEWTAFDGDLEEVFSRDQLLTNVMVYWVTRTATSSIRLYYEGRVAGRAGVPHQYVSVPTGVAQFPGDLSGIPRAWVERRYNVTRWTQMRKGSHFAAMEVPELFVEEVRAFFGAMR
jgi:microsomal epoxide hydrolase